MKDAHLTDTCVPCRLVTSPDDAGGYTHWGASATTQEPDNLQGSENCGAANWTEATDDTRWGWSDVACNVGLPVICKIPRKLLADLDVTCTQFMPNQQGLSAMQLATLSNVLIDVAFLLLKRFQPFICSRGHLRVHVRLHGLPHHCHGPPPAAPDEQQP
jgi:hypothetical protein